MSHRLVRMSLHHATQQLPRRIFISQGNRKSKPLDGKQRAERYPIVSPMMSGKRITVGGVAVRWRNEPHAVGLNDRTLAKDHPRQFERWLMDRCCLRADACSFAVANDQVNCNLHQPAFDSGAIHLESREWVNAPYVAMGRNRVAENPSRRIKLAASNIVPTAQHAALEVRDADRIHA